MGAGGDGVASSSWSSSGGVKGYSSSHALSRNPFHALAWRSSTVGARFRPGLPTLAYSRIARIIGAGRRTRESYREDAVVGISCKTAETCPIEPAQRVPTRRVRKGSRAWEVRFSKASFRASSSSSYTPSVLVALTLHRRHPRQQFATWRLQPGMATAPSSRSTPGRSRSRVLKKACTPTDHHLTFRLA